MKENKHKEIKQKPGGRLPKEQPSRALPKTMARQVWLKSKERVLSATKTDSEGSYASAQEMEEQGIRQGETLMEDGAVSALGKAGTAARRHFVHEHKPNGWPTQEEIRGVDSVSPDTMNPDPKTAARQEQKRRAAQKQSRIFQERQRQSKNAVRGLRGVDRDQKQLRTAANTVRQEKQAQQAAQRTQTILRHARQTAREGVETAQKAATVLHSAIRHLLAALQSLAAALIAGGWIAVFIVLLICLIALVAGSAYGIFFAAETPDENAISVTQLFGGGELLGGFVQGSGDVMTPGMDTVFADGVLQWPLPIAGTITSPQGYRTDPITGEISYHSGTDITAPEGTPILAAADGTVTIANATDSWGGSYGYYVKIDHGSGLTTLYAHCSSICVTAGQQVKSGQVIAYVGQTGRATGPHLHFEIQGGANVN